MSDYLQKQIDARQHRIAALDKERAMLIAELNAYRDALANETGSPAHVASPLSRKQQVRLLHVFGTWRAVLEGLIGFKRFNARDVKLIAHKLYEQGAVKKALTDDGVRAQLSIYAKKGTVSRLGGGNYCLTELTKSALAPPRKSGLSQENKLLGPKLTTLDQATAGDAR